MDAITLLKTDHKAVEKLFKEFEKTTSAAEVTRRRLVNQVIEALSVHAAIEEQHFYPAVREFVEGEEAATLESIEEHHVVKWVLSELEGMEPTDERFEPKMTVLMEMVRHHVQEEEHDLFPAVRAALGRKQLGEIGDAMESTKVIAPHRPHPKAPDTPPANLVTGPLGALADRAREAIHVVHD